MGLMAGIEHAGEIVMAAPEAHHDVRILGAGTISRGVHAVVDAVNQQIEIDALRRRALSAATVALARVDASVLDGL